MAQRSFKEVLLSPWQPGAPLRHKGASRGCYCHGYGRDVQPPSAGLADYRTALKCCKIDFKQKMDNSIICLPEFSPGHFILRDSFSCGLGFVALFLMKSNLKLRGAFFLTCCISSMYGEQYSNFVGGESDKRFGKKDVSN